jgi:uncharacterized membrane protein YccF (DUF307 family)
MAVGTARERDTERQRGATDFLRGNRRRSLVVSPDVDGIRLLLNIVWLVLHGWALALAYLLAGVIACLLVVTIPFGIASFRLAGYAAWPFGRTTVPAPGAGVASGLGNVLWFLFVGWWLSLLHVVAGVAYCLTIIGIPFGIALFKLALVGLFPLGKQVVPTDVPLTWRTAGSSIERSRVA